MKIRFIFKKSFVFFSLFFLTLEFSECTKQKTGEQPKENKMTHKTIEQVLKEHTDHLMSIPGVVGTAQGELYGKPCIKVFVVKKTPELKRRIPTDLEGFPVIIEETGEFKALDNH